ncbi:hypothetical protein GP5015_1117 [gamma proteobacterium HTCC5015]|nr:hypothetical protein GP5015_1117 [gamma proteobacterium HTCC5015]
MTIPAPSPPRPHRRSRTLIVAPAQAGAQWLYHPAHLKTLDSRLRGNDDGLGYPQGVIRNTCGRPASGRQCVVNCELVAKHPTHRIHHQIAASAAPPRSDDDTPTVTTAPSSSLPRRREPSGFTAPHTQRRWIPACAGMTRGGYEDSKSSLQ